MRGDRDGSGGIARPERVGAVLGTGTEVGKTWVAARVLEHLRARGVTVAARKPAQSAEPDDPAPSDADVLAAATGEDPLAVCPAHRRYAVAMAPPMAAAALGLPAFTVADLAAEIAWPAGPRAASGAGDGTTPRAHVAGAGTGPATTGTATGDGADEPARAVHEPVQPVHGPRPAAGGGPGATGDGVAVGLVETAGGVLSPAAADGTSLDLARAVGPDLLVLVADAGLGTINGVRLSVAALGAGGAATVVVLNRYRPADPLHRANREVLEGDGLDVVVDPAVLAHRLHP